MPGSERTRRESSAQAADELQWAADRLRTEVVGTLVEEGERLWRRLAQAHEGAEGRVHERIADLEGEMSARIDAHADGEAVRLAEYARGLEELSERRLEAHASALTEAVAERAGEAIAAQIIQLRSEAADHIAMRAREIVELARIARAAEVEREERLARGLATIDERSGAALAERLEILEDSVRQLADEIEQRTRPRPLEIPRRSSNGTSSLG